VPRVQNLGLIEADNFMELDPIVPFPILPNDDETETEFEKRVDKVDLKHLSEEDANKIRNLIRKYRRVFSNVPGSLDKNIMTHKIELELGFKPKYQNPYRVPERRRIRLVFSSGVNVFPDNPEHVLFYLALKKTSSFKLMRRVLSLARWIRLLNFRPGSLITFPEFLSKQCSEIRVIYVMKMYVINVL
jgi:hypothetical protein